MTGSIGLPEFFMDESKWQLILLVYFGGMIFGLPIVVWRWYDEPVSGLVGCSCPFFLLFSFVC